MTTDQLIPAELPLQPVPWVDDGWHITWSELTGAVIGHSHKRNKGQGRSRHLGTTRSPAGLADLVREYAAHRAATQPCPSGKVRFRTEELAIQALAKAMLSGRERRRERRRYRCDACGDWHLTSSSVWRSAIHIGQNRPQQTPAAAGVESQPQRARGPGHQALGEGARPGPRNQPSTGPSTTPNGRPASREHHG